MPKKPKNKSQPTPPPRSHLRPDDSAFQAKSDRDAEDWRVKNDKAKELIMSTLVPGSEPWKIAEPLENASDIWKALEARYAPSKGANGSSWEDNQTIDLRQTDIEITESQHEAKREDVDVEVRKQEEVARKEARVRATQEFRESMPNQDQRLLWALLHGGKPETEAWFNGTTMQNTESLDENHQT